MGKIRHYAGLPLGSLVHLGVLGQRRHRETITSRLRLLAASNDSVDDMHYKYRVWGSSLS
jgi:hypothetical protein